MSDLVLWICGRCSTVIRSKGAPTACYEDQGGCRRSAEDSSFLGPFPEGAKDALVIDATYRRLRLENGLPEPEAIEALERARDEPPEVIREVLRQSCLLDEWPVGWREEEWPQLAKWTTFEDVEYWLGRVVDTSDTNLFLSPVLAAQGHLYPLLRVIGPAFHVIPVSGRFSAGKSRCGEILTYVGGGVWLASATVPGLKSARKDGPVIVGIDEGDEAERDNPGVKAYLLASHDWTARYLKFSEPGEKGKRELVEIPYGGPVVITFRKRPWPAVASRAHIMEMEPSKRFQVSDDGSGAGFKRLLGPARIWLRGKCEEALRDKNELWAMRRTHEPDFIARLNRVAENAPLLRQRDFARMVLFVAELLGLDMEKVEERLTKTIAEQEVESENATILEAIESDPLFQLEEVGVEELRLSVQKYLRDRKEFVDVTRNRFADVLKEMGFSREKGPTWKRIDRDGRQFVAIFPNLWRHEKGPARGATGATGATATHMEAGSTRSTLQTFGDTSSIAIPNDGTPVIGPGESPMVVLSIVRKLCAGDHSAYAAEIVRLAEVQGVSPDRTKAALQRFVRSGDLWQPIVGTYRLAELLPP
jgi:hypothetical protein